MRNRENRGVLSRMASSFGRNARELKQLFIDPLAREAIRPVVNVRSGIDGLVPGGRTGQESLQTSFGEVKPFANLGEVAQGRSAKEQGALTPGEAALGAFEVATAPFAPEGTLKAFAKPISKPLATLDKTLGVSKGLKNSAIKSYEKALSPTKERTKALAKKVAPELARMRTIATESGLGRKVAKGLEETGKKFDELGKMEGNVPLKSVVDTFKKAKEKFVVDGKMVDQHSWKVLDEIESVVSQFGDSMPAQSLRELGRVWDEDVAQAGGFAGKTLDEGKIVGAKKVGANAIRDLLAKEHPDFAAVNKTYNFFKNLDEVLEASKLRQTGQSGLVRQAAGGIGGAIIGAPAGPLVAGLASTAGQRLAELGATTAWKTMKGATKSMLADAIANGEHSIPRIVEFLGKYPSNAFIKPAILTEFLNKEGKLTPEEKQQEDQAREARIEEIRQRLSGKEGVDDVQTEDPEKQKRLEDIRRRLLEE